MMKTVCVVDDQQISRDAVCLVLKDSRQVQVIGTFASAELLIKEFDGLRPEITIVDLDLPGMSGIEAIITLKPNFPHCKFLVVTNYSDDARLFEAIRAGADGYLLKKDAFNNLEAALVSIFDGGAPMTPEIARKVIQYFQKQASVDNFISLTEKEKIVLQLLVDGLLYKEIASRMEVSIDMIKKSTHNIYEKIQVRTRSEAVKKYFTKGG